LDESSTSTATTQDDPIAMYFTVDFNNEDDVFIKMEKEFMYENSIAFKRKWGNIEYSNIKTTDPKDMDPTIDFLKEGEPFWSRKTLEFFLKK
jgi:hypothetical protein